MADSYSQFSEEIGDITPEEAAWIQETLSMSCEGLEGDALKQWCDARGLEPDFHEDSLDVWPNFEWSLNNQDHTFWFYAEESFDEDHITEFLRMFLKKFRPKVVITITSAETCSKPRIGEFGGLWFAISAKEILRGGTYRDALEAAQVLFNDL